MTQPQLQGSDWNGIPVRIDEDMPPDEFEVMHPDEPIEDVRRRAWDRRRRRLVQPTKQDSGGS